MHGDYGDIQGGGVNFSGQSEPQKSEDGRATVVNGESG